MDRRIEEVEKCQDGDFDSLMIHLAKGWCINDQGCHTFGENSMKLVRATMKTVKPCRCDECKQIEKEK